MTSNRRIKREAREEFRREERRRRINTHKQDLRLRRSHREALIDNLIRTVVRPR